MGPWLHSYVDQTKQGELEYPGADNVARNAALAFFDYHLYGAKNGWPLLPAVRYYQMGENTWEQTDDWDALGERELSLYLHMDLMLRPEQPTTQEPQNLSFPTNPHEPSPSYGGARFNPFDLTVKPGPLDIREVVEHRFDLLIYTTEVLQAPVSVQGGMRVELFMSCDRTDTDVSVRLCDVYPDGRSMILTDGIQRARFRESTATEVLLEPNVTTEMTVTLEEMAHTFLPGHRIKLVLAGADYPRFDLNLNDGGKMYTDGDTLNAITKIFSSALLPSRLVLETAGEPSAISPALLPQAMGIGDVHPHPLSRSQGSGMNISLDVEEGSQAELAVIDLLGRRIWSATLRGKTQTQNIFWNGIGLDGRRAAPGLYTLLLQTTTERQVRKFIVSP
jgi:putative CocE/NonD family hydrolase